MSTDAGSSAGSSDESAAVVAYSERNDLSGAPVRTLDDLLIRDGKAAQATVDEQVEIMRLLSEKIAQANVIIVELNREIDENSDFIGQQHRNIESLDSEAASLEKQLQQTEGHLKTSETLHSLKTS